MISFSSPCTILQSPLVYDLNFKFKSVDFLQSVGAQEVADLHRVVTPRFRLKNLATSPHVTQLLLDADGPLAELHRRMLEAGCEVDPEWKLDTGSGSCDALVFGRETIQHIQQRDREKVKTIGQKVQYC